MENKKREMSKGMWNLLDQIDQVSEENMQRCGKSFPSMESSERLVGVVMDDWTKAAYTLSRQFGYEIQRIKVDLEDSMSSLSEEEKRAKGIQYHALDQAVDALKELFWHSVRTELNAFGSSLSIRKDWSVVDSPDDNSMKRSIVGAILGGLLK
jgi:hypothetical protein